MERIALYVALFGIVLLVGLLSTLLVVRYNSSWPPFAVTDLQPREASSTQLLSID